MSKHILVVDDDEVLRESLSYNLRQAGYQVDTAASAEAALAQVEITPPELILLDIGLPGMDGMEALRRLRDRFPVILVTARRRELDEILGLEMGAEDYITKPFARDVLLARVRALLRRPRTTNAGVQSVAHLPLIIGDLVIDPAAHTVTVAGRSVSLSPLEFRLLHILALEANRVIPTEELLSRVWGTEYMGEPQIVYVYIRDLRTKLETDPRHPARIVTVRGVGYKLMAQE